MRLEGGNKESSRKRWRDIKWRDYIIFLCPDSLLTSLLTCTIASSSVPLWPAPALLGCLLRENFLFQLDLPWVVPWGHASRAERHLRRIPSGIFPLGISTLFAVGNEITLYLLRIQPSLNLLSDNFKPPSIDSTKTGTMELKKGKEKTQFIVEHSSSQVLIASIWSLYYADGIW